MKLAKEVFYRLAREMRSIASSAMDFGPSGFEGGVDGESNSATFFMVVESVNTDFIKVDENAWGVDIGSGSGIASMSYFNGGMGLNMIGIECNEHRFKYSLTLQNRLLGPLYGKKYSEYAKMSRFYEGDGIKCLIELLGSTVPIVHLKLIYWFREGWSEKDVKAILDYFNRLVVNLEWLICDMNEQKLLKYGFKGSIISSVRFSGPMNRSSNSRTLHVHHVQMHCSSTRKKTGIIHTVSEREKSILMNFRSSSEEAYSRTSAELELLQIRSDNSKKDRAASLKRKRSIELAPEPHPKIKKARCPPRLPKIKKERCSPRFSKSAKEAQFRANTVVSRPRQRIQTHNSKKVRSAFLKCKRSIKPAPEPKTPEIKTAAPRCSPHIKAKVNKEKTKRQLIREKQEAKRIQMERIELEYLDFIKCLKEKMELSP